MITPEFLTILERGGVKTLTFAPEAGTERLRQRINKNLSEQQILEAARVIARSRIKQVKLYFLLGLPGETDEDIEGIVQLVTKIHQILAPAKLRSLTVSANAFIPKPFTPFQWAPMETVSRIRRKRNYLQQQLKKLHGVRFTRKSARQELLQGIFSLGDQQVAGAIFNSVNNNLDWNTALQQAAIDVPALINKPRNYADRLPWDFINYGVSRQRLWKQWQQSLSEYPA